MSFILDALKRSEQERASNTHNPAIAVDIADTKESHHKRFPWLLILIVLALIIGATALFLFKQNPDNKIEPNQPVAIEKITSNSDKQADKATDNSRLNTNKPETQKSTSKIVIPPPPLASQARLPEVKQPQSLAQQTQKKPASVKPDKSKEKVQSEPSSEPASTATVEPPKPSEEDLPSIQDLPDNDQNLLSAYEINTHFYSDRPGKSFALVNMKKYREGDFIQGSQHKVEQITAQGVVINYGNGRVLLRSH